MTFGRAINEKFHFVIVTIISYTNHVINSLKKQLH